MEVKCPRRQSRCERELIRRFDKDDLNDDEREAPERLRGSGTLANMTRLSTGRSTEALRRRIDRGWWVPEVQNARYGKAEVRDERVPE